MALKDDLLAGPAPRALPNKIESWRATLDEETRDAFDGAVRNLEWSDNGLANMLSGSGFKVSDSTIRQYRVNLGIKA